MSSTGVDLEVPRGCAFGFLGANGAGKTTLIRLLLGLAEPTAGRMRVLDHDLPGTSTADHEAEISVPIDKAHAGGEHRRGLRGNLHRPTRRARSRSRGSDAVVLRPAP